METKWINSFAFLWDQPSLYFRMTKLTATTTSNTNPLLNRILLNFINYLLLIVFVRHTIVLVTQLVLLIYIYLFLQSSYLYTVILLIHSYVFSWRSQAVRAENFDSFPSNTAILSGSVKFSVIQYYVSVFVIKQISKLHWHTYDC